jgi:hypothetical protein
MGDHHLVGLEPDRTKCRGKVNSPSYSSPALGRQDVRFSSLWFLGPELGNFPHLLLPGSPVFGCGLRVRTLAKPGSEAVRLGLSHRTGFSVSPTWRQAIVGLSIHNQVSQFPNKYSLSVLLSVCVYFVASVFLKNPD